MSLKQMMTRFKRYGMFLFVILIIVFASGLFPLARRVNQYYSTSYVRLAKNFLREVLEEEQPIFGVVVKRLSKDLADISTGVDLSGLLRYENLPWLSSELRGLFVRGSSVKFLIEDGAQILLIEIPSSLFGEILPAEMGYIFLIAQDGTIVACNDLNLLGSKLSSKKGFANLNGSIGFASFEPFEYGGFIGSFVPLTTYVTLLLPYFLVTIAALCGAAVWLGFAYSFENRLVTAVDLVLENINQSLSSLGKTKEVVYVPIETRIQELDKLQEAIHKLVEEQKASWHEMNAMMQSLQDTVNELEETHKILQDKDTQIIATLAEAIELKDANTLGHSDRVVTLALELAKEVGLTDPADLEAIKFGALLHDIGKIGIPEHILNKPGRLTSQEYEIMKMHPIYGEKIVRRVSGWDLVADIVRHHHENFDGSGYPDGLKGDQISIRAQIVGLVDVFSALIEDRPYRPAMSVEQAVRLMEKEMVGTKFDPRLFRAFLNVLERYLRDFDVNS